MNQVVIIFVPTGASKRNFEVEPREYQASFEIPETHNQHEPVDVARQRDERSPLWAWFLPNPCPQHCGHPSERFEVNFALQSLS